MRDPILSVQDEADGSVHYEMDTYLARTEAEKKLNVPIFDAAFPPGDVRRYGSVGTSDDSAVLSAALAQSQQGGVTVVVPRGLTMSAKDVAIEGRVKLQVEGTIVGAAGGSSIFEVSGDEVEISGSGEIDTNGLSYGVHGTGSRLLIKELTFRGNVIEHYVLASGDYAEVRDCRVLPGYDCSNIPFCFAGVPNTIIKRPKFLNNQLRDVRGFNVQFRYCSQFQCLGNSFENPLYIYAVTASDAQSTFSGIDLSVDDIDRFAANVGGVQREITSVTNTGGGTYSFELASAAADGQVVAFYGSRSLEHIQVNSLCQGGLIANNTCDGTGDSNIVIGADYHDGVINPGAAVEADFPTNIVVSSNILRNAFAASVNVSQVSGGRVGGNDCSAWGISWDTAGGPFWCAIYAGAGSSIQVDPNTLHADNTRAQFGVGGWEVSSDVSGIDFRKSRAPKKRFSKQNFLGTYTARYFTAAGSVGVSTNERKFDVDIDDGPVIEYPTLQTLLDAAQSVVGIPDDSVYWDNQVVDGPTPVARDTSLKQGGSASAQVASGKTWQATPLARDIFKSSIVWVSFWAFNSGANQGECQVFYDNGENDSEPRLTMKVRSQGWEQYEMAIPIRDFGSGGFFLRFAGPPTSGTTNFQYIRLLYRPTDLV